MLVSSRKGCLSIVKHLLTSGADTELKDLVSFNIMECGGIPCMSLFILCGTTGMPCG